MDEVKIFEIKEDIAERYAPYADSIREKLKEKKKNRNIKKIQAAKWPPLKMGCLK